MVELQSNKKLNYIAYKIYNIIYGATATSAHRVLLMIQAMLRILISKYIILHQLSELSKSFLSIEF